MLSNQKNKLTKNTNRSLEMMQTFNKERKLNKALDIMIKKYK